MSAIKIPIDGLWRCLCPSIDSIALHPSLSLKILPKLPHRPRINNSFVHRARSFCTSQCTNNIPAPSWGRSPTPYAVRSSRPVPDAGPSKDNLRPDPKSESLWERSEALVEGAGTYYERRIAADKFSRYKEFLNMPTISVAELQEIFGGLSNERLHTRLQGFDAQEGAYGLMIGLVEYLIRNRGEKPTAVHYNALIRANADPDFGSVEAVRALLTEMKESEIPLDSAICHSVLLVLAIHPDYLLRAQIMEEMKQRWFGLSPDGWHNLVTGYLRDRQFEIAMDKLEQMHTDGIRVQPWLYDIFIYQFCEMRQFDEAFTLLQHRIEHARTEISNYMWYYLLDHFSSAFHYEGTKQIWNYRVKSSDLNPSDGMCANVLNLSARFADPDLATATIRILSKRNSFLSTYHYEALLETYVGAGDIITAFRILKIMSKAGIEPTSGSTRALFIHLSRDYETARGGIKMLHDLKNDGHVLPIAATNVVIEALVKTKNHKEAMKLYEQLHTICPSGPNTETFNILLSSANRGMATKDRAIFLSSELRALNVSPDQITYDRLIIICLDRKNKDYEDAFRYLSEMIEVGRGQKDRDGKKGWWMRPGTAAMAVMRCVEARDERAWGVLEEMEVRWGGWGRFRKECEANWEKAGKGENIWWDRGRENKDEKKTEVLEEQEVQAA